MPEVSSLNLIHELHGLDDTKYFSGLDSFAHAHKRRRARRRRFIESADDGRFDQREFRVGTSRLDGWLVGCLMRRLKRRLRRRMSARVGSANSRRSGSMNAGNRTGYHILRIGEPGPPDADAVFTPLHLKLGDASLIGERDQLAYFIDCHKG